MIRKRAKGLSPFFTLPCFLLFFCFLVPIIKYFFYIFVTGKDKEIIMVRWLGAFCSKSCSNLYQKVVQLFFGKPSKKCIHQTNWHSLWTMLGVNHHKLRQKRNLLNLFSHEKKLHNRKQTVTLDEDQLEAGFALLQ